MKIKTPDKTWEHLYPPFRERLQKTLSETAHAVNEAFILAEGYRSVERQLHLYSQGRTAPGPIVTWKRSPTWHGTGLAADVLPKLKGYNAPRAWWEKLRQIGEKHGLDNPAWSNGDLCHLQASDPGLRARALVWVRNGFKEPVVPPPSKERIAVTIDGEPVPDADAFLEEGRCWVKLRPVTDGLDLVIAEVTGRGEARKARLVDDVHQWEIPLRIRQGSGFARAADLPAEVQWDGKGKRLAIARRA